MPRKPTGGKRGRPPKVRTIQLTDLQRKAIDIVFADPLHRSLQLFPTSELVKRLGVDRRTVHKWKHDKIMDEALSVRATNRITKTLIERNARKFAKEAELRAWQQERMSAEYQNRERVIDYYCRQKWTGPTMSPDGKKMVNTVNEYIRIMIHEYPNTLPQEVVERVAKDLGIRNK